MTEQTRSRRPVAPKQVRLIRVILYVQAAATLLGPAITVLTVVERFDHNQDVDPLAYLSVAVSLLAGIALLVCAVRVAAGPSWVRPLALTAEAVVILIGPINVISGFPQEPGAMALGVGVVVLLFRPEVEEWLIERRSPF
jgi:hypothetical protein